jgi:hypothetical protein
MSLKIMTQTILHIIKKFGFIHKLFGFWQSRLRRAAQIIFVGFSLFLVSACTPNNTPPLPTPDATQRAERLAQRQILPDAPLNRFGIVEGFWLPELTCELGVGWERIIFDWGQHEPENSQSWNTLNVDDRWLVAAQDCHREVVALLKHTPAWATDGSPNAGLPRGLYLPDDDPENLWANFVRKTVTYYTGRMGRGITHYIIWNEPDIEPGTYGFIFDGTLEDYAQLLKVAYRVAKEVNPAAQIHLAGTTYWHDINVGRRLYLDRLIETLQQDPDAAANNAYFDTVSLHIYFRTDTVYDIVMQTRAILETYGLGDKTIWINETNAAPSNDPEWRVEGSQFPVDLEQQAAFLVQAAALALAADVERIAVYKLYDQSLPPGSESFGILNPANQQPRPAFFAWQMITTYFDTAETALLKQHPDLNAVLLAYPDETPLLVAWSRTAAEITLEIKTTDAIEQMDIYGTISAATAENGVYTVRLPGAKCEDRQEGCFIGGRPVLLRLPPNSSITAKTPSGTQTITFGIEES